MWLKNGNHTVIATPMGGSILSWQWREHQILGPAGIVRAGDELKPRGETHWCLPNFGSVRPETGYADFPKHGLLRETTLEVMDIVTSGSSSVRFEERGEMLGWSGWSAVQAIGVQVAVKDDGINATLRVEGEKRSERIPILPGLHPYFAVPAQGLAAEMNGKLIAFVKSGATEGVGKEARMLERTGEVVVALDGVGHVHLDLPDDCTHIVLWSDKPAEYVCVEPVFGTPGTYGTPEGRWLEPGKAIRCSVGFRFEPA